MRTEEIALIQAAIQSEGHSWTAGTNEIAALPPADQARYLGYVPDAHELSLAARELQAAALSARAAAAAGAPSAKDWRNVGGQSFVSAIRNQGQCGSCVAFGSLATVEAAVRIARQDPGYGIDLSEAALFYCIARSQGRLCEGAAGGWFVQAALTGLQDTGAPDEACYPYTAGDQNCTNRCADWQSRVTRIAGSTELDTVGAMKDWLTSKGPVISCFTVYNDFYAYSAGVYKRTAAATPVGGHCVSVVGYDDVAGCWICKNSWGPSFGEGGFFRIAYGEVGIDAVMWGVSVGPGPAPGGTYVPLYRYWNGSAGDHFYTTNWAELGNGNHGWGYEGVQCFIAPDNRAGLVPLHRYWNPTNSDHFYTTNWAELGNGNYGWGYEGVQGYVAPSQLAGTVPLHRYWNPGIGDHFYTTNWAELGGGASGWGYEGIQCYVWGPTMSAGFGGTETPATFRTGTAGSPPSTFSMARSGVMSTPAPATFASRPAAASPAPTFVTAAPARADKPAGGCGCHGAPEMRVTVEHSR